MTVENGQYLVYFTTRETEKAYSLPRSFSLMIVDKLGKTGYILARTG